MGEDFFCEQNTLDKKEELEICKKRLQAFYENINYVSGELIDYYTYQIKAEQAKFAYLINEVRKEMNQN